MKHFTITRLSWVINLDPDPAYKDRIMRRYLALVTFLEKQKLTTHPLLVNGQIPSDFTLNSADLTEEGLKVIKTGYDKWGKGVDRGNSPEDVSLLEKTLSQIRAQSNAV